MAARVRSRATFIAAGLVLLLACFPRLTEAQMGRLSPDSRIKGAVIPIYLPNESKPAIILKAEQIYTAYQRKGFFRIGLLPMAVVEGVTLDIRQPGALAPALARLRNWLKPPGGGAAIEFRKVAFQFPAETQQGLKAGIIRFGANGQWQLSDGVAYQGPNTQIQSPRGQFQVSGEKAGQLSMEMPGAPVEIDLFAFLKSNHKPQTEQTK